MDRRARWLRAADEAARLGLKPLALDDRLWTVPSASGPRDYYVRGLDRWGLRYACDCDAGERGLPCKHAASVAATPGEALRRGRYREARAIARAVGREEVDACTA